MILATQRPSMSLKTNNLRAKYPSKILFESETLKSMHLIDSHAHLDMYSSDDLPQVLARAYAADVRNILAIGIGEGPHEMHRALEIAESTNSPELPQIYASAGIHPQEAASATPDALAQLTTLAANPRCVAIG